jgi:hypothetical protein
MISRRRHHRWPLVLLGVMLLLGHVCVLPLHEPVSLAHAGAGDAHGHDDGVHAGSCEAVATATCDLGSPLALTEAPALPSDVTIAITAVVAHVDADASPPSPPLFLLHAALLI